jgi:hypothetical protein
MEEGSVYLNQGQMEDRRWKRAATTLKRSEAGGQREAIDLSPFLL